MNAPDAFKMMLTLRNLVYLLVPVRDLSLRSYLVTLTENPVRNWSSIQNMCKYKTQTSALI